MEGPKAPSALARMGEVIGRLFPRPSVLSAWIVALPALAQLSALGISWVVAPDITTQSELMGAAASFALIALGLAGAGRLPVALPHALVVALSPLLFGGLGLIHHQLSQWLATSAGGTLESLDSGQLVIAGLWLVLGYPGWYLAGVQMRTRVHRARIARVNTALQTASSFQRNRIRAELRSVLRDLASRLDRVVQEMTMEQAGSDQAVARTMPHRDELADQLVDAIDERIYRSVQAEPPAARRPWWERVEPAHPVILPTVVLATLVLLETTGLIPVAGFVLLALLITALGHAALRQLGATMQPSLTRAAAMAGGSVVTAAASSLLLASSFALGPLIAPWVVWVIVVAHAVLGGALATWWQVASDTEADQNQMARERVRECVQLAIRYDTLSGTNARTLYSATLGTLIFASVDLTNSRAKPGSREAALETMATRIVGELHIRVAQREPLPEELIRLVAAVWQSVAEVTVSFRQEVFSRFVWADESIRRLQNSLGEIVVDAVATASAPVTVVLAESDLSLVATVRSRSDFGVADGAVTTAEGAVEVVHTLDATPLTKSPLRQPSEVFAS